MWSIRLRATKEIRTTSCNSLLSHGGDDAERDLGAFSSERATEMNERTGGPNNGERAVHDAYWAACPAESGDAVSTHEDQATYP